MRFACPPPVMSEVCGVGHPVEPLADVRGTEARSAQIERCAGVARCFQVRLNKVEPSKAERACNLLAKDDARATLADETEEFRPEVALVIEAELLPGPAKWPAWTTSCPTVPIVGPPGEAHAIAPDADAGEEVALLEASEIICSNIDN